MKKRQDGKLFFGTLFHKHMEHYYQTDSVYEAHNMTNAWVCEQDLSAMDQVFYQDLIQLFHEVSDNYETVYAGQSDGWEVIATELRFAIPLYDDSGEVLDFAYEGTIDLVYSDNGADLKFMDHKTVSSIDRYVSNAVLDRQISRYWWALTALQQGHGYIWENEDWRDVKESVTGKLLMAYKPVAEFVYNLIRKEAPKHPRELKGGELSRAKDQKTTPALYTKALMERGLDPEDYADVIANFSDETFVKRVSIVRNWSECEAAINDFVNAAKDMMDVRKAVDSGDESRIYWNITWDTPTFNSYYPLIQAEVMGENVALVKAALYETEEWDEENNFIKVGD